MITHNPDDEAEGGAAAAALIPSHAGVPHPTPLAVAAAAELTLL